MTPRRFRLARSLARMACPLGAGLALAVAAHATTPGLARRRLLRTAGLLAVTFLMFTLPLAPPSAVAAQPTAQADSYTDLRAATDQAVWKWSRGLTSAFDDLIQSRWADPAQGQPRAKEVRQILEQFGPQAAEQVGPPIPREFQYLGSLRTGSRNLRFCYLIPHARNHYPIEIGCLLLDGRWRVIAVNLGAGVLPLAARFLQAERAEHLRFDPAPAGGGLQPASLSDLKHACDATLARLASGTTAGALTPLIQQHWIASGISAEQIMAYEAKKLKPPVDQPGGVGKPLPGQSELLGIAYLGTNYATLNYSLPYERGTATWRFVLYRPAREWRVRDILHNEVDEVEERLLQPVRPATATVSATDRPTLALLEQMMAGVAKADPGPVVEAHAKLSIHRDQPEQLALFSKHILAELPSLPEHLGKSLTNSVLRLGFISHDSLSKTHCYVNLRHRSAFPVESIVMLRHGEWRSTFVSLGGGAVPGMERFMRYERRTSSPPATAQSPKLAPSDVAALEASCARFMSNAVTGKLNGALHTLMQTHKYAGPEQASNATLMEAKAQSALDDLAKVLGQPQPDGAEYLGLGRLGDFLAKLTYQQCFLKGTRLWHFTFYRREGEWYLDELGIPDEHSSMDTPLSTVARPPNQIRPKATPLSPAKP